MTAARIRPRVTASTYGESSQRLKILFTEGSSTSARQSLYALGGLGHTIDLCDSQRLCLGRFSRYVRRWHHAPPFASQPMAYLDFLEERLSAEPYDVLFPVHDQVLLLSRFRDRFTPLAGLALPSFPSLEQVQSKIKFVQLLDEIGLPQPEFAIVRRASELPIEGPYPFYIKQEYSTAGCGVWKVDNAGELRAFIDRQERQEDGAQPLLLQRPARGEYRVVQTVFQHGRLIGAHCYRSRAEGVGGSAQARLGIVEPAVIDQVRRLGEHLDWHGALHLEFFQDAATGKVEFIEANPRIGETMNATLSGVNLCELLMQASLGKTLGEPPSTCPGVGTHSVLMSLLAAAQRGASRRALLADLRQAASGKGVYANSQEELIRLWEDPLSLLPAAYVTIRLLLKPAAAHRMVEQTVRQYSAGADAVRNIEALGTSKETV